MNLQKKEKVLNLKWIVLVICLITFFLIAKEALSQEDINLDINGYKIITSMFRADFMLHIAKTITNLGGAIFLIIFTLAVIIFMKNEKIELSIALNLIVATIINTSLKNILQRPRPTQYRLIDETGFSFPSGHSMVSMSFYGFLIYLIFKYIKNKKIKIISITLLSILILSIGASRIYLGVHYTSDVLGGYLLGVSYLIIYTSLMGKFLEKESDKKCKT